MKLFYALLIATLIGVGANSGQLSFIKRHSGSEPAGNNGYTLAQPASESAQAIITEIGELFLKSFSFVLIPVLVLYSLTRLVLTYRKLLFTAAALIILINASILSTDLVNISIDYGQFGPFMNSIKKFIISAGFVRAASGFIGIYAGTTAYLKEGKRVLA